MLFRVTLDLERIASVPTHLFVALIFWPARKHNITGILQAKDETRTKFRLIVEAPESKMSTYTTYIGMVSTVIAVMSIVSIEGEVSEARFSDFQMRYHREEKSSDMTPEKYEIANRGAVYMSLSDLTVRANQSKDRKQRDDSSYELSSEDEDTRAAVVPDPSSESEAGERRNVLAAEEQLINESFPSRTGSEADLLPESSFTSNNLCESGASGIVSRTGSEGWNRSGDFDSFQESQEMETDSQALQYEEGREIRARSQHEAEEEDVGGEAAEPQEEDVGGEAEEPQARFGSEFHEEFERVLNEATEHAEVEQERDRVSSQQSNELFSQSVLSRKRR